MDDNILPMDDGHLYCEVCGQGSPIILAHGFSFDRTSWDLNISALKKKHTVYSYDLRGFGKSSKPTKAYSHTKDLHQLIKKLEIKKPILMGLSLGANVILEYASLNINDISGLILASPGLPGMPWKGERPTDLVARHALEKGVEAGKEKWLELPLFQSVHYNPAAYKAIKDMVDNYSGWHWENKNPVIWESGLDKKCKDISAKTLIISGGADLKGYRDIALFLSQKIPSAELMICDEVGHMLNIEQPDFFSKTVCDFTTRLEIEL